MATDIGEDIGEQFTGHSQLADALERLLWIEPNPRVLTVVGEAGTGTSTALARAAAEAEQGYRVIQLDLGQVIADAAGHGRASDEPALGLVQTLAVRIAALAPGWRRGALVKEAGDLDDLPDDLDVAALSGGAETVADSPLTIRVGDEREGVRRRWWLAGLTEVARRLRRTRFVLVVDEAHLLGVFDPVCRDERLPNAAAEHVSWFAGHVLPALLETAPHLRVVLGGSRPIPVGTVPAEHLRLSRWTAEQSAEHLAAHGYDDAELAQAVHRVCNGSPLVTATLVRHVLPGAGALADGSAGDQTDGGGGGSDGGGSDGSGSDGSRGKASRLAALAAEALVDSWLPRHVLASVDATDRELLAAATTLRVISDQALRALCPKAATDGTRLVRLRGDWSSDSYDDASGGTVWRMHPVLRTWLLDHFDAVERTVALADADPDATTNQVTASTEGTTATENAAAPKNTENITGAASTAAAAGDTEKEEQAKVTDALARSPRQLHLAAAEYYENLPGFPGGAGEANASVIEAVYHRFAAGDDSRMSHWRDHLCRAVRGGQLTRVHALALAALEARPYGEGSATLAHIWPVALLGAAYAAFLRNDLSEAGTFAVAAIDGFNEAASHKDSPEDSPEPDSPEPDAVELDASSGRTHSRDELDEGTLDENAPGKRDAHAHHDRLRALQLAGQLDWLGWRCREAAQHWLDAVEACRLLDDDNETLAALCAAGEASLACGELLVADDVLDEAYSLSVEISADDSGNDSGHEAGDGDGGTATGNTETDDNARDNAGSDDATGFPRLPLGSLGEAEDDMRTASSVRWLGETAAALGETERAEVLLDQAEERATATGSDQRLLADVLRLKAELAGDDVAASEVLLERAHATARRCADRTSLAQVLLTQAALESRIATQASTDVPPADDHSDEPASGTSTTAGTKTSGGTKTTDDTKTTKSKPAGARPATDAAAIPAPLAIPALERLPPAHVAQAVAAAANRNAEADVALRYRQRRAQHLASAALDLAQEIGHAPVQAAALALVGDYDQALALTRRIGDRRGELILGIDLGAQAQKAGDTDTARTYFSAAVAVAEEIGDSPNAERARRGLADLADPSRPAAPPTARGAKA